MFELASLSFTKYLYRIRIIVAKLPKKSSNELEMERGNETTIPVFFPVEPPQQQLMPTPKQLQAIRDFQRQPDFIVHEVVEVDDSDNDSVDTDDGHRRNNSSFGNDAFVDASGRVVNDKFGNKEFIDDLRREREEEEQWREVEKRRMEQEGDKEVGEDAKGGAKEDVVVQGRHHQKQKENTSSNANEDNEVQDNYGVD